MLLSPPTSRQIACTPFVGGKQVKKEIRGGMARVAQTCELEPLTVVAGTKDIPTGSIAYVRGEMCASVWGQKTYTLKEQTVIMVPEHEVLVIEAPPGGNTWVGPG